MKILDRIKNEKVEWKRLGDVCEFQNGFSFKREKLHEKGEFPIIRIKNIQENKINFEDTLYFNKNDYKEDLEYYKLKKDDVVIAMSGATVGKIGKYELNDDCYINQRVGKFLPKEDLNGCYLYHYLLFSYKKIYKLASGSGAQPNLSSKDMLEKFEIPIPSMETQEKIVKILDTLIKYIDTLKLEREQRTKQYEYYLNYLISEKYLLKEVDKKELVYTTLGEIGEFIRGNGLQKKDFLEIGNPVIHYGQIYTKYGFSTTETISFTSDEVFLKLRKAKKNDILMATTSENMEDVGKSVVWLGEDEIGISGDMHIYRTKENSKYIAYYFQTLEFRKQKGRKGIGTKVIRIHSDDMKNFTLVLPPIKTQEKIVEMLDKFEKIVNNLKEGLPKEIELRQKQYEYYRSKLFEF